MASARFVVPVFQWVNASSVVGAGYKLYAYVTATSTPANTYSDSAITIPNANPVVANGSGYWGPIFLDGSVTYKFVLTDSSGTTIWSVDPYTPGTDASNFTFTQTGTSAVTRTVSAKLKDGAVNAADFGATGDGSTNDTTFIQAALNTGKSVILNVGTFMVSTLRFKADGQQIIGQGGGHINVAGLTVLKARSAVAFVVSVSDGAVHRQSCAISDLDIDSNSLANRCVEWYDDTIAGGAWDNKCYRGRYQNALVCTLYGGNTAAPGFANDCIAENISFKNAPIHFKTNGAISGFGQKCTFYGATTYAVQLLAGAAIDIVGAVFTSNAIDVKCSNVQQVSVTNSWLENSTGGVLVADTAGTFSFTNCELSTTNATFLMDFGSAAGAYNVTGCFCYSGSSSFTLKNINATAERNFLGSSGLAPEDNIRMYTAKNIGSGNFYVYSASGTLTNTQSLSVSCGRGTWKWAVDAYRPAAGTFRYHRAGTATLHDGDAETIAYDLAAAGGSGGTETFTIAAANNVITATYGTASTVSAAITVFGTKAI